MTDPTTDTATATAINVSGILGSIITHASANDVRYEIQGVLLRSTADGHELVATDGHRLARFVAKTAPADSIGWGDVIIPTSAIRAANGRLRTARFAFGSSRSMERSPPTMT